MKENVQFPVLPLPYKLKLITPIETENGNTEELIFTRYPTGQDIEDWDMRTMTPKGYLKLASKLLNISPVFLGKMDARDVGEVINFLFPFTV